MRVTGVGRSRRSRESLSVPLDEFVLVSDLGKVLPYAEHLVLATPHTVETENLIGAKELALMPRGAILINIGRGQLVDEAALVTALTSASMSSWKNHSPRTAHSGTCRTSS